MLHINSVADTQNDSFLDPQQERSYEFMFLRPYLRL